MLVIRSDRTPAPIRKAYLGWLQFVSNPETEILPRLVTVPGRRASTPENELGWSGAQFYNLYHLFGGPPFAYAIGSWHVPTISGYHGASSAVWVGLDGNLPGNPGGGINDLIQIGTEQDVDAGNYAWLEFLPFDITEVEPLNQMNGQRLPIYPGDAVVAAVYVGDSNGSIDPSGTWGWFLISDMTTGLGTGWIGRQYPSSVFAGITAEWILERPSGNGAWPPLANYGTVTVPFSQYWPAGAWTTSNTWYYLWNMPYVYDYQMVNETWPNPRQPLSTATIGNMPNCSGCSTPNEISFQFVNAGP